MNIHRSIILNSLKTGNNSNFHQLVNEQTKYSSVYSNNGTLFSKKQNNLSINTCYNMDESQKP